MRVLRLGNKSYRKKPADTGDRYTKKGLEKCELRDFEKLFPGIGVYTRAEPIGAIGFDDPTLEHTPDNNLLNQFFGVVSSVENVTNIGATNTYYWSSERQTNIKED